LIRDRFFVLFWLIPLATPSDATQLKKRELKKRLMTWVWQTSLAVSRDAIQLAK